MYHTQGTHKSTPCVINPRFVKTTTHRGKRKKTKSNIHTSGKHGLPE